MEKGIKEVEERRKAMSIIGILMGTSKQSAL